MSRPHAIKVFGERNSGTNYLEDLLKLNVALPHLRSVEPRALVQRIGHRPRQALIDAYFRLTQRQNLGWKHAAAPTPSQMLQWSASGVLIVTVTKNPYAWLLSLHKRPHHHRGPVPDLQTFIEAPWRAAWRDNLGRRNLRSPVDLWNLKNASYRALPDAVTLRYEDLLANPGGVIERLVEQHGLPQRSDAFRNVERSTKEASKDFDWYRSYYLEERWREKLSSRQIESINERLDSEVVRTFGYNLLTA